ncbi:MAG TPA: CDP-archaeol synthase [Xanthobacteraceae bacterium]|nr:CDP-archaeol synthase [Xanthobacteraceae bacterium]
MQPVLILQLTILLALANGTPLLAAWLLGSRLAFPLDGGLAFFDGRPLLGGSKTVRGIVAAVLATTAVAPLIGLSTGVGAVVGASAMAGDAFSSFVKRRLGLPPSSRATGLDQIPESLLPALACRAMLPLTAWDMVVVVVIFFVGDIVASWSLYRAHLRDRPY